MNFKQRSAFCTLGAAVACSAASCVASPHPPRTPGHLQDAPWAEVWETWGTPSCSGVPSPRCPHPIPTRRHSSSRQGAGCLCQRTQRGWEHASEPWMGPVLRKNPMRAIPRPGSATCSPASPTGLLSALSALGGLSSRSYLPAFWALQHPALRQGVRQDPAPGG